MVSIIDHNEMVQHRFAKLIDGMEGLTYERRLVILQFPTLQYRRKRGRPIQVFKLLHNMYDADYSTFFDKASGSITRGHSWKLKTTHSRINCRANFSSVNVVGDWNSLPETVVNSTSFNQFKGSLDRHLRAEMFALVWHLVEIHLVYNTVNVMQSLGISLHRITVYGWHSQALRISSLSLQLSSHHTYIFIT